MKMYQTIFNDGYQNVAIGQRAYHKKAFNAVLEGFHLMQVFNEMYEGRIAWDDDAPLMGNRENLQIATGFLPDAQNPFNVMIRTVHVFNKRGPLAQAADVSGLSDRELEWAQFLADLIETGHSGEFQLVEEGR